MTPNSSEPNRGDGAFTLIEVVAGMVLVAGLLISTMTALTHYEASVSRLAWQRRADDACEQLLSRWHSSADGLPITAIGRVVGEPSLLYTVAPAGVQAVCGRPVAMVRLEIRRESAGMSAADWPILARVDYVRAIDPTRGLSP